MMYIQDLVNCDYLISLEEVKLKINNNIILFLFLVNNKSIERVTHSNILGVWLSNALSWSHHIYHVT